MGACCSCQRAEKFDGFFVEEDVVEKEVEDEGLIVGRGESGARVRLQGSSKFISMFDQQGKKGINQDAMTVWENFIGEKDTFFCGVFDGHGPSGHKVSRYVRDNLPSKISLSSKRSNDSISSIAVDDGGGSDDDSDDQDIDKIQNPFYSLWKSRIIKSFTDMDEDLEGDAAIESYCSGTTAVTVLKQREHLIIANLGDSRAVICTRDDQDHLVPLQLTVDLKPNLPSEAERIKSCQGRVMAMDGEPNVYRVWMPDEDCPGLAMARAFGDFCLKDFGLISTPQVSYRRLTERDEFVVLATDGIWDALSNDEVIRIVASARKRSMAARSLVDHAVRAWRYKYPCAKTDDCAAVCLFFKRQRRVFTKSVSEVTELSVNYSELGLHRYANANKQTDDGLDTVLISELNESRDHKTDSSEKHHHLGGVVWRRRRPSDTIEM